MRRLVSPALLLITISPLSSQDPPPRPFVAFVQQRVEFLPNFKTSADYRINSESSLAAPLSGRIALKASYVVRFDNQPEPTFEKTDRLLTTGLQITF